MYDLNNQPTPMNESIKTTTSKSFAVLLFVAILVIGAVLLHFAYQGPASFPALCLLGLGVFICACLVYSAVQTADQWNKAVVLRLGKFHALRGPGLFFIIPFIDAIVYWIDTRVLTTAFKAEKTLTKDTVPVDVVAVLFWKVLDPEKGRPKCCRLSKRYKLGIANGFARCHRQDSAFRHAGRQGQNQRLVTKDH